MRLWHRMNVTAQLSASGRLLECPISCAAQIRSYRWSFSNLLRLIGFCKDWIAKLPRKAIMAHDAIQLVLHHGYAVLFVWVLWEQI
ncbi:MAG: hypothetical protein ACRD1J_11530, partial [Terriglobia bacterium]